jgi:hypothetical protein
LSGPARTAEELDTAPLIYSIRARTSGLPSTDDLLAAISERVPDPSVFAERPPVFVRATASNRNLDSYYTRMAESTLRQYAANAGEGVSVLNSHNGGSLGFGQTFDGRYVAGNQPRTEIDFYVQRGLRLNEVANDDLIDALRGGSVKDVSVGFVPGWYRCGICDARMERFYGMTVPTCGHWPGDELAVSEKDPSKGTRTAFAWVEDARLSELSIVFDGSTPGAMVTSVRARQALDDSATPPQIREALEARYSQARTFAGAEIPPPQEVKTVEVTPEQVAAFRLTMTEVGQAPDAAPDAAIRSVVDELKTLRSLPAEVERLKPFEDEATRLRPLADEGRQYRADLVTDALAEGVRAFEAGKFSEETYRGLLEAAPLETVKRMRDDWAEQAKLRFPGGRKTQDTAEPTPITERKRRPARAYS